MDEYLDENGMLMDIAADGLRADKLFENAMARAPFLHSIVEERGTWGISHTRVPTESRPGHVALIAGFYEDVSAVTKGWKMNPVNFDSVFNQTFKTWSFGSPDILPMFAHGASDPNRVEMVMYPAESEDFAGHDASKLDTFVFEQVEALFKKSQIDKKLFKQLHSDRIVFFLHLLGIDTNGHGHRPHSKEYLDNIKLVDKGLARMEQLIQEFYKDDKTAFVMTADHGMSNRGSHGDGHPDNTRTPIVAWGAGLARPIKVKPTGHDDISQDWGLNHISRYDVEQADIAPLMSTLVGIPYPMNSVGVIPLPFLNNSEHFKALAAFGNAKQIFSQFLVKESLKKKTALYFRPFKPLLDHAVRLSTIQTAIDKNRIAEAEAQSFELINFSLEGLNYYQKYDWFFLKAVITLGYLGWMAYCIIFVIQKYAKEPLKTPGRRKKSEDTSGHWNLIALGVLVSMFVMLTLKKSPFQYYLYGLCPIFFWNEVIKKRSVVFGVLSSIKADLHLGKTVAEIVLYILGLELLIYSYFQREILSYILIIAGIAWPVILGRSFRSEHPKLVLFWLVSCWASSVFTLLPVEKGENISEV